MEIQEAVDFVKLGNPTSWAKTKENKSRVDRMGMLLHVLAGVRVECSWCARGEVYKHLRKWLEGNAHL
jgi:hypothetical protein